MSGRSAYVRKKITETKAPASRGGRRRSTHSSDRDDITISDFPAPNGFNAGGAGIGPARFLRFSESVLRETEGHPQYMLVESSSASVSGGSTDGSNRRGRNTSGNGSGYGHHYQYHQGPLEDFAYARARRPNIKTEDVSGIEKSGFRSVLDKKTEEVRRGIAKKFSFGKKKKKKDEAQDGDEDKEEEEEEEGKDTGRQPQLWSAPSQLRPESDTTVRPGLDQTFFNPTDEEDDAGGDYYDGWRQWRQQQQQQGVFNEVWDPARNFTSPPPSIKLPPLPATVQVASIKRWCGNGKPAQRWNKLRKDPELWDPNGDVLIHLFHRGMQPKPNASFRLSSHIIEATESRYLASMLHEGSTEGSDAYGSGFPPSPVGGPPFLLPYQGEGGGGGGGGGSGGGGGIRMGGHGRRLGRGGVPTPPVCDENGNMVTDVQDAQINYEMYFPSPANLTRQEQVRYHITTRNVFALLYHASLVGVSLYQALSDLHRRLEQYLPVSSDPLGTVIHYVTSRGLDDARNDPDAAAGLLAWSEAPDVRWDEGWREAFSHAAGMLGPRLESAADFRHVSPVTRQLLERASLEISLRVQAAEDRLAKFDYSDMWRQQQHQHQQHQHQQQGGVALDNINSSKTTTSTTATTATRPDNDNDGPSSSSSSATSAARASADALQAFFLQFYARRHGAWPPPPTGLGSPTGEATDNDYSPWLTRRIVQHLQADFGRLYDYLVNRDVVFDGSETRSSRKWIMISESTRAPVEADDSGANVPLTDMLVEWDNRWRFPHIPGPMPLVPESIAPTINPQPENTHAAASSRPLIDKRGKSKDKKHKDKDKGRDRDRDKDTDSGSNGNGSSKLAATLERRIHFAYNEATNIYALSKPHGSAPSSLPSSPSLVDSFIKFEKRDRLLEVDPSIARRGRWVLIYGILQTLASVSVDAPAVRYRDGVEYHLSVRMQGQRVPPWRGANGHGPAGARKKEEMLQAAHELSHCWTVGQLWEEEEGEEENVGSAYETSGLGCGGANGMGVARGIMYDGGAGAGADVGGNRIGRSPLRQGRAVGGGGAGAGGYRSFSTTTGSAMSVYSETDTASSVRMPATPFSARAMSHDGRGRGGVREGQGPIWGTAFVTSGSSSVGVPEREVEGEEEDEGEDEEDEWRRSDTVAKALRDPTDSAGLSSSMERGRARARNTPTGGDAVGVLPLGFPSRPISRRDNLVVAGSLPPGTLSKHVASLQQKPQKESAGDKPLSIRDFDYLDAIDDHDP